MSLISIAGDVDDDPVGNLGRQRLHRDLAGDVLHHAALLDPGSVLGALELDRDLGLDLLVEPHLLEVEVLEAAPDGVSLLLLDHHRDRGRALDLEVEEGVALGDHVLRRALRHLERAGLCAAAVDDAGDQPVTAQAAAGAGAELGCAERPGVWRDRRPLAGQRIENARAHPSGTSDQGGT